MTPLRVWLARARALVGRPAHDRALDDEVRAHLEDLTDELIEGGLPPVDAAAEARRRFGGVDQIKEAYRDQRGWPSLDGLRQDVALAWRHLSMQRGSTTTAVFSLGLGIGVSMAFFTIVNAICLRGLPIEAPDRVLFLTTRDREAKPAGLSYGEFSDLRRRTAPFNRVGAYTAAPFSLADERDAPERVSGSYVSAEAFHALGTAPDLGREFRPADEVAGAPPVVVLGHTLWMSRYGGNGSVIGHVVRVNGTPTTIVGVMPSGFRFPGQADAWLPLGALPGVTEQPRSARGLMAFGRLSDDESFSGAARALTDFARQLESQYPDTNRGIRFSAVPINDQFNGNVADPVWLAFLTAGLLVLLVACANVANLLLARLASRSREVALRLAMGATRLRIVRQTLVESALLAGLSGLAGLAFAVSAVRLLAWSYPASSPLPYWITFDVDGRVLAALVATCMASVLFFGMVPALQGSSVSVNDLLKDGGRHGTVSQRSRRWSATFLVVQFALTLVLLANVSMDLRRELGPGGPGVSIDPAPLLTARVALPPAKYASPDDRQRFFDQLDAKLVGANGVTVTTVASQLPPDGGAPMRLRHPDQALGPGEEGEPVFVARIGARYFETLGVRLVAGRGLTDNDSNPGQEGVVVSEQMAERVFPASAALGQRIGLVNSGRPDETPIWRTVVGVAPDLRQGPLVRPLVYLPNRDAPPASAVVLVRTVAGPDSLMPWVREVVADLDRDLPLFRVMPLELAVRESSWNGRVSSDILRSISAIALMLALVGLYGVTAHAVTQRTHEIGIRVALGASPRNVTWLVLRRALTYVGAGLAVGLLFTYVFERTFIGTVDTTGGQSLTSPLNLGLVVGLVIVIAIVACAWPAARAARVQPTATLRAE